MQREFWLERWAQGRIRFHQTTVSAALLGNEALFLGDDPHRVFVPLCGKSVDLPWLRSCGHEVLGVEFAEIAVRALFDEHGLSCEVTEEPPLRRFAGDGITVWCGDFFALRPDALGPVDRVWDRAALIALPPEDRVRYAAHLGRLAPGATMLLETLDYDATVMPGPPFPVTLDEVRRLYGSATFLDERDVLDEEERWRIAGHQWMRATVSLIEL